jgi:hypothetical protein
MKSVCVKTEESYTLTRAGILRSGPTKNRALSLEMTCLAVDQQVIGIQSWKSINLVHGE